MTALPARPRKRGEPLPQRASVEDGGWNRELLDFATTELKIGVCLRCIRFALAEANLFEPAEVEPVLHSLGLGDGDQDQAQFTLTARHPGKAQFSITASVEVHLGYPGPAYWATVSSPAVEVTVSP